MRYENSRRRKPHQEKRETQPHRDGESTKRPPLPLVHRQDREPPRQPHIPRPLNIEPHRALLRLHHLRNPNLILPNPLHNPPNQRRNLLSPPTPLPHRPLLNQRHRRLPLLTAPEIRKLILQHLPRNHLAGPERGAKLLEEEDYARDALRQQPRLGGRRQRGEEGCVRVLEEEARVGVEDGVGEGCGRRGVRERGCGGALGEGEGLLGRCVGCLDGGPEGVVWVYGGLVVFYGEEIGQGGDCRWVLVSFLLFIFVPLEEGAWKSRGLVLPFALWARVLVCWFWTGAVRAMVSFVDMSLVDVFGRSLDNMWYSLLDSCRRTLYVFVCVCTNIQIPSSYTGAGASLLYPFEPRAPGSMAPLTRPNEGGVREQWRATGAFQTPSHPPCNGQPISAAVILLPLSRPGLAAARRVAWKAVDPPAVVGDRQAPSRRQGPPPFTILNNSGSAMAFCRFTTTVVMTFPFHASSLQCPALFPQHFYTPVVVVVINL